MSTVIFRCDASPSIGGGHWVRCSALAAELVQRGVNPVFLSRRVAGMTRLPLASGCQLVELPPSLPVIDGYPWSEDEQLMDADACIAVMREFDATAIVHDHYGLTHIWQERVSTRLGPLPLLALDDFPWRRHRCDVLVVTSGSDSGEEFAGLKPSTAHYRGGPQFAVLRPEFAHRRAESLDRRLTNQDVGIKRLLVTMGATDAEGLTCDVLAALEGMNFTGEVRVVLSSLSPIIPRVRLAAFRLRRAKLIVDPVDMAEQMVWADAAIGTGGQTSWERCVLGLPSLTVVACDNQHRVAARLSEAGAAIVVQGPWPRPQEYVHGIRELCVRARCHAMVNASASLCDGGGAGRIAELVLGAAISK